MIPRESILEVARKCPKVAILVDECYYEFMDPATPCPLLVTLAPQSPTLLPAFPTFPVPAYQPRGPDQTRGYQPNQPENSYQPPSPYHQQEDHRQPASPYQPYQQSPVEENNYAEPAKGYQPPVSPYQQAPSKGYQPPVQPYVAPAKGYQPPQSPANGYQPSEPPSNGYQPAQPPHDGYYQPRENPTNSYQPTRSRAPDPHTLYPPVGPSGAALGPNMDDYAEDSDAEEEEEDEDDDGEWYEDPDSTTDGDEDYGNPAPWETAEDDEYYDTRSPIAYSSEDYSMAYGPPTRTGPRQYQPYAGGCPAGEVQCGGIEECISVDVLCDGEYDCTNAWDEIDQGC